MALPDDYEFEEEDNDNASVTSQRSGSPCSNSPEPLPTPPASDERSSYGQDFIGNVSRQLPPRYFLTGSLDATMRIWDSATGRCLKTFFGKLNP